MTRSFLAITQIAELVTARSVRQRSSSVRHHLRAGRESLLFGAAVVLPRATGLLTLPVYTRLLGPEDFGRYELLISTVALLYAFALLGLDFAMSVRFYGHDEVERRRDAASALAVAAGASVVAAAVLLALAGVLGPALLQSSQGGVPFAVAIAAVPFNVLAGVLAMYLRLRFEGSAFFRAMLAGAIGGTASGLVLVVAAQWGLVGATVGLAAVHAITFAFLWVGARRMVDLRSADRRTSIQLVRLGTPLAFAGGASWVFALADRFFVAAFLGFAQLGLYASAARLATILALIQFGFHAAWGPVALRWRSVADRDRRYAASLRLVSIVGGATVAIVSWLAHPLLSLLAGPAYVDAHNVVWLLAASVLFSAMFFVVQIGANLAQSGGSIARTVAVAAVLNTMANLALIPRLGYLGAGIATLVTYLSAYVIMYLMSQKVTRLHLGFRQATIWAVGWTAVAAASTVVPTAIRPMADILVLGSAMIVGLAAITQTVAVLGFSSPASASSGVGSDDAEIELTRRQ